MMIDVDGCRRGLPMMEMKKKDGGGVGGDGSKVVDIVEVV
jgi:hypothetical protein